MPTQPTSNVVSDWCSLIRRGERAAALHQKYLHYVARFERWDKCKGWLRYVVDSPVTALAAIFNRRPLPSEWRRLPTSEEDFQLELFSGHIRRMYIPD